ncbi:MAG: hypothetical protein Q7T80_03050 [Methanoregula sp.]|nr:hypothetical protein [Methanoregula sp.]
MRSAKSHQKDMEIPGQYEGIETGLKDYLQTLWSDTVMTTTMSGKRYRCTSARILAEVMRALYDIRSQDYFLMVNLNDECRGT